MKIIGRGPPILALHGGPGFGQDYLFNALDFLANDHTLISYDQLRCDWVPNLTLSGLAQQLITVIEQLRDSGMPPLRIIAHSWGVLVLAAAVAMKSGNMLLREQILGGVAVNSVPLCRPLYDQSLKRFLKNIPLKTQIEVRARAALGFDGPSLLRVLWPYYLKPGTGSASPPPDFSFHLPTYLSVSRSLGRFDFTAEADFLSRFAILQSCHDATSPDMLGEWVTRCPHIELIDYAGHFPMLEDPKLWRNSIVSCLRSTFGNQSM